MNRIVQDLMVVNGTTSTSEPVSLGTHNAFVGELWTKSRTGTGVVTITYQGSNDRTAWTTLKEAGGTPPDRTLASTGVIRNPVTCRGETSGTVCRLGIA